MPLLWWVATLSPIAFRSVALGVASAAANAPSVSDFDRYSGLPPIGFVPVALIAILYALGEEMGWRGCLTSSPDNRGGNERLRLHPGRADRWARVAPAQAFDPRPPGGRDERRSSPPVRGARRSQRVSNREISTCRRDCRSRTRSYVPSRHRRRRELLRRRQRGHRSRRHEDHERLRSAELRSSTTRLDGSSSSGSAIASILPA